MATNNATTALQKSRTVLTKAKYSGLDFDTILEEILTRAQSKYGSSFNSFALSELGVVLTESFAAAYDQLAFYLDRRATDTYLPLVRTYRNAAYLARQLGYKISPAVSASVDETVSLSEVKAFDVTIPEGFKFKGPNNLVFEAARATTFLAGSGPLDTKKIPLYQGETKTQTFTSTGAANQSFDLPRLVAGQFIVIGSVFVTVDGDEWEEQDLLSFGNTNQFEIGYGDTPPALRFGDGIVGAIPTQNATITVKYVVSSGKAGKVTRGQITSVVSPLIVSFQEIKLTLTNEEASIGGDDMESLSSIRANAGRVFKTRQVAVTEGDYNTLSGAFSSPLFGRVAVAKAVSARSAAADIELQNLLTDIRNAVAAFIPAVTVELDAANAGLTNLEDVLLGLLATQLTDIAGLTTDATTELNNGISSARTSKNKATEVAVTATDIGAQAAALSATIAGIAVGGADQLTAGTQVALLSVLSFIGSTATNMNTQALLLQASAESEALSFAAGIDKLAEIGLDIVTPDTKLLEAETNRVAMLAQVDAIQANLETIATLIVDQNTAVNDAADQIYAHVDAFLAADCKANLISVPILARDASGFYAAPSFGLISELQTFLDARKEITHTVSVTSGAIFLVPAVLVIRLAVLPGFSETTLASTVRTIMEGVLRDRAFADSLVLSDLYDAVEGTPGLGFKNIRIAGYLDSLSVTQTDKLDADGNLIVTPTEVVTLGSITITTETVVPAS